MAKAMRFLTGAVLAAGLAFPAFAEDAPTADTIVAVVNGTNITLGNLIVAREALPDQYKSLPPDVLFKGILDQLVQQTLLAGLEAGRDDPAWLAGTLRNLAALAAQGKPARHIGVVFGQSRGKGVPARPVRDEEDVVRSRRVQHCGDGVLALVLQWASGGCRARHQRQHRGCGGFSHGNPGVAGSSVRDGLQ